MKNKKNVNPYEYHKNDPDPYANNKTNLQILGKTVLYAVGVGIVCLILRYFGVY